MNSASVAEALPEEMAMAILLKLPVKSLIRFRSLSKSTSAAIGSARFVKRHHSFQRENSNPRILVRVLSRRYYGEKPYIAAISGELHRTENIRMAFADITGPCNGLICLHEWKERISISNPATRELQYIPPSPIPNRPKTETGSVNLGFDSRSADYKVIVLLSNFFTNEGAWTDRVELYSLTSKSWREIHLPDMIFLASSAFSDQKNDRVLWVGCRKKEDQTLILQFSIRNESFSSIRLPKNAGYQQTVFVEYPDADIALIPYAQVYLPHSVKTRTHQRLNYPLINETSPFFLNWTFNCASCMICISA